MMKWFKFINLFGLDELFCGGSFKKGMKSVEFLEMKVLFFWEIFLCRIVDIYEVVGVDVCLLVEYVGVVFVGWKDLVFKVGCLVVNFW